MKKTNIVIIIIILLSFAISIYFYPKMPDRVASHWNSQGQVDGYMSKFWGLFLMPIISIALFLMFIIIPKIDPLKKNIQKFRKYFDGFMIILFLFLFYIFLLTVIWNSGISFNMNTLLLPALGIVFYYCGVLIQNAKRNWFIGIRTPWTLSSDKVWDKTHKIGAKLFKISGIIAISAIFFPKFAMFLVLVPVILSAIFVVIYSYFEYRKTR